MKASLPTKTSATKCNICLYDNKEKGEEKKRLCDMQINVCTEMFSFIFPVRNLNWIIWGFLLEGVCIGGWGGGGGYIQFVPV